MRIQNILCLIMALVLSACDNGSKGDANNLTPPNELPLEEQKHELVSGTTSAFDFTKTIRPFSYQVIKANLSYEEAAARYSIGCKAQGNPSGDYQSLDPRLLVGMAHVEEQGSDSPLREANQNISTKTISEITNNLVVVNQNYSMLTGMPAGLDTIDKVFVDIPHMQQRKSFEFKPNEYPKVDYDFRMNLTPAAVQYLQADLSRTSWWCTVNWTDGAQYERTTDLINYNFAGKNIEAYLIKSKDTGNVICSAFLSNDQRVEVMIASGTSRRVEIYSNQILGQDMVNCGGEEIYRGQAVELDSGRIMSSYVEKIHSAPLR